MKHGKYWLPLLALIALGFLLGGCPKSGKMMKNDTVKPITIERIG